MSTGSIGLDFALGIGGLPRGRVIEIYGPESSGNTTLSLHVVAEAQKAGGTCAFVDAEHALDPVYARKLGVDIDELFVISDYIYMGGRLICSDSPGRSFCAYVERHGGELKDSAAAAAGAGSQPPLEPTDETS